MINLFKIPLRCKPLYYIKEKIEKFDVVQTTVILPTNRNLRVVASYKNWELDLQTVAEFTKRAANYKRPLLPKELRDYYIYKSAKQLIKDEGFLSMDKEIKNFTDFISTSSAILPFFRELSAEMIPEELLKYESMYQNHEQQVAQLMKLWSDYQCEIKHNGFMDEWEHYSKPELNREYLDRYNRFVFVISGYLTNYEIAQLIEIASMGKTVDIYFNYLDEFHPQHSKLVKKFGKEVLKESNDTFPTYIALNHPSVLEKCTNEDTVGIIHNSNDTIYQKIALLPYRVAKNIKTVEIYPCASTLAQFDLITRRIMEQHFNNNIPLNKMAVILPSDNMLPWFISSDKFMLYNVSAGMPVKFFPFYRHLEILVETISNQEEYRFKLTDLKVLLSEDIYKETNYVEVINKMLRSGSLYISISELSGEFWQQARELLEPFIADNTTYCKTCEELVLILKKTLTYLIAEQIPGKKLEIEAVQKVIDEIEKISFLYRRIDELINPTDVLSHIFEKISSISVPVSKGAVPVTGVLESRNMQYDYLFIPDLNSSSFPVVQQKDFFFNTEMRKKLELPTHNDRENLQKSYLYQMVARAKQTLLTYTDSEDTQPSPFISEIMAKSGAASVDKESKGETLYNPPQYINFPVPGSFNIHKFTPYIDITDETNNFLKNFTYSSTSLNIFRKCQMQFFFKYIMKLVPPEAPVEDADMRVLGSCLHKVLENLFKDNISALSPEYETKMVYYFDKYISKYDYFTKNAVGLFQARALKKQFPKLCEKEKERLIQGAKIIGFELSKNMVFAGIKIKGIIDRLDETEHGFSVIDYKYKKIQPPSFLNFDKTELQLPLYGLMIKNEYGKYPSELLWFDLKEGRGFIEGFMPEMLDDFAVYLEDYIMRNITTGERFMPTIEAESCTYCPYRYFCHETLSL